MDHSIHGYLCKRSTEELTALLQYGCKVDNYIILEINAILKEREKFPDQSNDPAQSMK